MKNSVRNVRVAPSRIPPTVVVFVSDISQLNCPGPRRIPSEELPQPVPFVAVPFAFRTFGIEQAAVELKVVGLNQPFALYLPPKRDSVLPGEAAIDAFVPGQYSAVEMMFDAPFKP